MQPSVGLLQPVRDAGRSLAQRGEGGGEKGAAAQKGAGQNQIKVSMALFL